MPPPACVDAGNSTIQLKWISRGLLSYQIEQREVELDDEGDDIGEAWRDAQLRSRKHLRGGNATVVQLAPATTYVFRIRMGTPSAGWGVWSEASAPATTAPLMAVWPSPEPLLADAADDDAAAAWHLDESELLEAVSYTHLTLPTKA